MKITAKARNRKDAAAKLIRALREFRVRGVQTNKSFLLNVLSNKEFLEGEVTTGFIGANPDLMSPLKEKDRAQKLLHYIGEVVVNGCVGDRNLYPFLPFSNSLSDSCSQCYT